MPRQRQRPRSVVSQAADLPPQGVDSLDLRLPQRLDLELLQQPASDKEACDFSGKQEPPRRGKRTAVAPAAAGREQPVDLRDGHVDAFEPKGVFEVEIPGRQNRNPLTACSPHAVVHGVGTTDPGPVDPGDVAGNPTGMEPSRQVTHRTDHDRVPIDGGSGRRTADRLEEVSTIPCCVDDDRKHASSSWREGARAPVTVAIGRFFAGKRRKSAGSPRPGSDVGARASSGQTAAARNPPQQAAPRPHDAQRLFE